MVKVTFEEKNYKSFKELCQDRGLNYIAFLNNRYRGLTLEECVYGKNAITFEGVTYPNMSVLCRELGVDYVTFLRLKNLGCTLEECVYGRKESKKERNRQKVEQVKSAKQVFFYRGVRYKSLRDFCRQHNLNYNMIIARHNLLGWTLEEAIEGREPTTNSPTAYIKREA